MEVRRFCAWIIVFYLSVVGIYILIYVMTHPTSDVFLHHFVAYKHPSKNLIQILSSSNMSARKIQMLAESMQYQFHLFKSLVLEVFQYICQ